MKSRCKDPAKARERDKQVQDQENHRAPWREGKNISGAEQVKGRDGVLENMLSLYKKHCETEYKTTKLPYYKKVIERIDTVGPEQPLQNTPV